MSEYCREQHPLLCEEASEEEPYIPRYYRRVHPMNNKGRARFSHKGAAAILTRWPDHWSSFLTYWWIGFGMVSLTIFIIYNSLFAFSMLPSAKMKPIHSITVNENEKTTAKNAALPDVFMHIFVDQNEDIDLKQYMPYIEIISSDFLDFKFNLIVVINDTNVGWLSAEENNDLALNMLWLKGKNIFQKESHNYNVNIEHISLSTFMDNSPLKKFWRSLPNQLIEFLTRTVSIWEKGGVAFNPVILTPRFQHTLYIEKLKKLLNNYAHTNKIITRPKLNKLDKAPKKFKKLNNIRDIINALENEDISANVFSQQALSEAENRDIQFIRHERHTTALVNNKTTNVTMVTGAENITSDSNQKEYKTIKNSTESTHPLEVSPNDSKMSLLPLFLEFLFHNKVDKPIPAEVINKTRKNLAVEPSPEKYSLSKKSLRQTEKDLNNIYKPVIVSASGIYNISEFDKLSITPLNNETEKNMEANRLTIDLKGNIIATDTPCHAFLGTIYSNVIHHNVEETITDFIIAELTIFCKGLLSSCLGIDLILL